MQNRAQFMKQLDYEVHHLNMYERGAAATANSSQLLRSLKEHGSRPNNEQLGEEMRQLQVHYGSPDGKTIIPMPVEKLLKQYRPELDKFYEKHHLGENALEQERIRHGLTEQNKEQAFRQAMKEAGLD